MRFRGRRCMFLFDQVPATWFPRHRDPPPGVAREGSLTGAFARYERLRSVAADESIEPAGRLLQRPLDLEQLDGQLVVGGAAVALREARDPLRELVECGGQWRQLCSLVVHAVGTYPFGS